MVYKHKLLHIFLAILFVNALLSIYLVLGPIIDQYIMAYNNSSTIQLALIYTYLALPAIVVSVFYSSAYIWLLFKRQKASLVPLIVCCCCYIVFYIHNLVKHYNDYSLAMLVLTIFTLFLLVLCKSAYNKAAMP